MAPLLPNDVVCRPACQMDHVHVDQALRSLPERAMRRHTTTVTVQIRTLGPISVTGLRAVVDGSLRTLLPGDVEIDVDCREDQ